MNLEQAACAGADPEIFYPDGVNKLVAARVAYIAKRFCEPCPIREQCLAGAQARGERHGIWGGVWFDRAWQDQRNAVTYRNRNLARARRMEQAS